VIKTFALCLFATAALASSGCRIDVQGSGIGGYASAREQKRLTLTGAPNLTVKTFNGSIELRPGERNEILVDIERRASTLEDAKEIVVETSEHGGNVLIEVKNPRRRQRDFIHFGSWTSPSVRLIITVPRELTVDATTGDGSIDASDVSGHIELRSGDGSIRIQRVQGEITVNTGDGAVMAREVQGTVAVNTGDGSVEMSGRFDALRAHTGDGFIGIDALAGSTMQREWTITSGDGGVRVRVPHEFDADVDVHTGDGSITTSGVEVLTPRRSPDEERHNVRGRIGQGGETLTVRTGDGSIEVVAR